MEKTKLKISIKDIGYYPKLVKKDDEGGRVFLLPYLSRHACIKLMNDEYGEIMWRDKYEALPDANSVLCIIEVYNKEIGEWVSRMDIGQLENVETNIGKEKSLFTDGFKRVCQKWGIGLDLQDFAVWANLREEEIKPQKDNKGYTLRYGIKDWTFTQEEPDGEIIVKDRWGNVRSGKPKNPNQGNDKSKKPNQNQDNKNKSQKGKADDKQNPIIVKGSDAYNACMNKIRNDKNALSKIKAQYFFKPGDMEVLEAYASKPSFNQKALEKALKIAESKPEEISDFLAGYRISDPWVSHINANHPEIIKAKNSQAE